jgi:hypothetical protein
MGLTGTLQVDQAASFHGTVAGNKLGDMGAGEVSSRDEQCLLLPNDLKSLGNILHALDAGGIVLRPNQHEVVVHYRKAFQSLALSKEFFFRRFGMYEHHVCIAAPGRASA